MRRNAQKISAVTVFQTTKEIRYIGCPREIHFKHNCPFFTAKVELMN